MIIYLFRITFLVFLFTSCSRNENAVTSFTGTAMTIDYRILIGDPLNDEQISRVRQSIHEAFQEVNNVYNKWNPDSEISKINRMKSNVIINISPQLESFLNDIDEIVKITEGKFDPTIEPLQSLWKSKLQQGTVPQENEINEILPAVGWDKIHFKNGLLYKDHDQSSLDLGGVAKGLCVDLLVDKIAACGLKNIYVEWGGEIKVLGEHPAKRPWRIFISSLGDNDPKNAIDFVMLSSGQAIATSGDYLQNWTIKDNDHETTYFHIIDSKTGRSLISTSGSIASASIKVPSCALADGLATAAMMFSNKEEAFAWLDQLKEKYPTICYWIVKRD